MTKRSAPPKQLSFASYEFSRKKRVTRRERFLGELEAVVPWVRLEAVIEPLCPSTGRGGAGREDARDQEAIRFVYGWTGFAPTTRVPSPPSPSPGASFLGVSESGASGGFVLYPNKPNNNFVNSVYAK
jgi:hypothetical protein